mmetsp:Transcript_18126/g.28108  ORF Transcript_18126/g.28108 Transcript_18126/m.28108 type:complete len:371 (+) Transcript_18126:91-1203(+)
MCFCKHFPWVALCLLEAQGNAALGTVDFQHHNVHFLRGGNDLAGMYVLFGPRHFGHVNETLNTRLQLNKGTVIGDVGHTAFVHGRQWVLRSNQIPWIFLQLLHAQADAVGFFVDLDHLNFDGFANCQDLRWVVHTTPCHVSYVQQAVNAAEVNKRTVFGDVFDHTVDRLAFGQVADDFCALFGTGLFEDRTTGHNDVATTTVHLQNLERLLQTHQWASVTHWAYVNLGTRQEGHGAAKVNCEAAFDATKDCAFNALFVCIGFLEAIPSFFTARHLTGDNRFAAGVFCRAQEDFYFVANSDFSSFTWICEFFKINAAFHFVAYVDDGLARFDCDHLAFDNGPLFGRVHFEAFLQEGFEFLHHFISHVASVS